MKLPNFQALIEGIFQSPWWIQIQTELPSCIYYFGPFDSRQDAETSQDGYLADLMAEHPKKVTVEIKRCRPAQLTICEAEA